MTFPVVASFDLLVAKSRLALYPRPFGGFGRLCSKAGSQGHLGPYTLCSASATAFLKTTSHMCNGVINAAETCAFHEYNASAPDKLGTALVAVS